MKAIADTSFVVATANRKDPSHKRCIAVFAPLDTIYLPQSTLAEVGYLLTQVAGNRGMAHFLRYLPQSKYELVALTAEDLTRTAQILHQYADTRVDFVDASVAAMAERLHITDILTLDRRDFSIIQPAHADHFTVLP